MTDYLAHPVFICGHRKGGTTVLLCLFDSHPQLLTFPIDSAFFYQAFPACETTSLEDTIAAVVSKTFRENLSEELAGVGAPDSIDIEAIADRYAHYAHAADHTPANHLRALIRAYADFCGQDPSRWKRWVEKTTSTEMYAQQVSEWFPDAKFIHVTRDPRDNWGSLRSGWEKRYQDQEETPSHLLQSLIDRAGLGLRMARLNEAALGTDRYKVVRYEDLTSNPHQGMRDLCAFLEIDYDPVLETPTVNGHPWKGNNFDGLAFSGLSNINVGRWPERIEKKEAAIIEAHLGDIMTDLGYDLCCDEGERARAAADHYKWFNSLGREQLRS